jgi:ammonia channel protein AmtB
VVAVHGIGGLSGLLATPRSTPPARTACSTAAASRSWAARRSRGLTYALARILEKFIGLRAAPDDELAGLDEAACPTCPPPPVQAPLAVRHP